MMTEKPPLNLDHLRRFLSIVFTPAAINQSAPCIEFRAMKARINYKTNHIVDAENNITIGGWFDRPDAVAYECHRLNCVSAYLTVNPVHHDLLARANNSLQRIKSGDGTTIEDITAIRYMIVDIDVERREGISATDEELAAGLALRDKILAEQDDIRANAHWGCTGNGGWILINLGTLPNEDAYRNQVRDVLHSLADRYGRKGRDKAYIDTNTKNPNRHLGIPGTLKCKGANMPDRPWRYVTIES